jgi:phosphatidylglycerophosphate synthase
VRRHEAVALLAFGVLLLVAGAAWLAGGWGLLGTGAALVLSGLFFDFADGKTNRGEGGT